MTTLSYAGSDTDYPARPDLRDALMPAPAEMVAAVLAPRVPAFRFRYRRVGGIRFLRIGNMQFSFCVTRKGIR